MYYLHRLKQLGLSGICMVLKREFNKRKFAHAYAQKALTYQAGSTWESITQKEQAPSFELFFTRYREENYYKIIIENSSFQKYLPELFNHKESYEKSAQEISAGFYHFLGATLQKKDGSFAWHEDTKSNQSPFGQYQYSFFETIRPLLHQKNKGDVAPESQQEQYGADIKIPWERSRLQHLFVLSWAIFQESPHSSTYEAVIIDHITKWLDDNPYLLGVNWLNPMEVALRALSLCWAFEALKKSTHCSLAFAQRLTCSLYDHLCYLQAQWELSDKPNNHYLADLTGALYLTLFFKSFSRVKMQIAPLQEALTQQYKHQILPDGSSYEGSTGYHRLVTEMHLHFSWLAHAYKLPLTAEHYAREQALIEFLAHCSSPGYFVTIGDDDSGKILAGIALPQDEPVTRKKLSDEEKPDHEKIAHEDGYKSKSPEQQTFFYPRFGLAFIINNRWHVSLRHQVFSEEQPSGHFHDDELSVTLSYKNIPVIVDPGSYCYTGDPCMRNYFRSAQVHSTVRVTEQYQLQQVIPRDLFTLDKIQIDPTDTPLKARFIATGPVGYQITRELLFDQPAHQETITIKDTVQLAEKKHRDNLIIRWSLQFHPEIVIAQRKIHEWLILHQKEPILTLQTTGSFSAEQSWHASAYGHKQPCTQLVFTTPATTQEHMFRIFPADYTL